MNLEELHQKIKKRQIDIDYRGYRFNPIEEKIRQTIENLKELTKDPRFRDNANNALQQQIVPYTPLVGLPFNYIGFYCFNCDLTCGMILTDDAHATFVPLSWYWEMFPLRGAIRPYLLRDLSCPAAFLRKSRKMTARINVPSGKLVFANFFRPDEIYMNREHEHDPGYSINALSGRFLLMQYLAKRNVGYGQMGNMNVTLFVREDGQEVIVGPGYVWDKQHNEIETNYEGFRRAGELSLDVWRWQCADTQVLATYENPLETCDGSTMDHVDIDVQAGYWKIEHYFDFSTRRDYDFGRPYSRLVYVDPKQQAAKRLATHKEMSLYIPSPKVIDLAHKAYEAIRKICRVRPIVRRYQRRILAEHRWEGVWRLNKILPGGVFTEMKTVLEPKDIYRLNDEDYAQFQLLCREQAQAEGLAVKALNYCPLLEAEDDEQQAKRAFGEAMLGELKCAEDFCLDDLLGDGTDTYEQAVATMLLLIEKHLSLEKKSQNIARLQLWKAAHKKI